MAPLAVQRRGFFLLYVAITLTFAANLFGVYQVFFGEFFKQQNVSLVCTTVNIVCYVGLAISMLRDLGLPSRFGRPRPVQTQKKEAGIAPAS